jgi:hypothetical protein
MTDEGVRLDYGFDVSEDYSGGLGDGGKREVGVSIGVRLGVLIPY